MIRTITLAGWLVFTSFGSLAQSTPPSRPFEVASVKPHEGPIPSMGISTSGSRLNAEAETPMGLIMYAYNLKNYQISPTAPLLALGDAFYDVVAKAEGGGIPTKDEFRQMVQLLLADRFKLKIHTEMREMPVYALVIAKNGPKFKPSAPDADPISLFHWTGRNNEITIPKASMDDVTGAVANSMLDRPVLDKTGLTGTYDVKLTYTPDRKSNRESEPDPNDISIFTAVQEQLGLKLEAQKAMVHILIVDYIEKPSAN